MRRAPSGRSAFKIAASMIAALIVLSGLSACSGSTSSDPGPTVDGAYDVCKKFVEDRLAYPGSSDFEGIDEADVTIHGNDATDVSYVDASNAFGAQSRRPFTCKVHYQGDGNWHLRSLDINLT